MPISVAANAKTTESLFANDHETFFNTIDPYRPSQ
jgi:hypothetical protein